MGANNKLGNKHGSSIGGDFIAQFFRHLIGQKSCDQK